MKKKKKFTNDVVYQMITNQIIEQMETGQFKWYKGWSGISGACNYKSKHPYTGVNAVITNFSRFKSPYWLTLKQCRELKGRVKKEEMTKYTYVIYANTVSIKEKQPDGSEVDKDIYLLRYYKIYNEEQITGIDFKIQKNEGAGTIKKIEDIIENMPFKPLIKHGGNRACYNAVTDTIKMPDKKAFHGSNEYYTTLSHELIHSTGHKDRLNRATLENWSGFGSKVYSFEELIAELGASFLCNKFDIKDKKIEKNTVAYLQGWIKILKKDNRFIFKASRHAQKATDYILGTYKGKDDDKEIIKEVQMA